MGQRHRMKPAPVRAISDQFAASKDVIGKAIMTLGREIELVQAPGGGRRPGGARRTVRILGAGRISGKRLAALEKKFGVKLPKGASACGGCGGEGVCRQVRRGQAGRGFQALAFPNGLSGAGEAAGAAGKVEVAEKVES